MVTATSLVLVVLAAVGSARAQFCTATKTATIYPPCAVRPCTTCVTIKPEPKRRSPDITLSPIGLGTLPIVTDAFPTACPYTKTVTTYAPCPTNYCIPVACPVPRDEMRRDVAHNKTKTKTPTPTPTPPPASSTPAFTTSYVKPTVLPPICPIATLLRVVPCPLIMCPMETDVYCAYDTLEAAEVLASNNAELAAAGISPAIERRQEVDDLTITKTITTLYPKTCTGGITITGKLPCPTRCPPRCTVFATETVYV